MALKGVDYRRQLIESLWAFGVDEAKLRGININDAKSWTNGTQNIHTKDENDKFYVHVMRQLGVNSDTMSRATKMSEWRADDKKPIDERVASYLKDVLGYKSTEGIHRRAAELGRQNPGMMDEKSRRRGYGEGHIMQALKEFLGPQAYTQATIKLKATHWLKPEIRGNVPEWNPMRTDNPYRKPGQPAPAPAPAPGAPSPKPGEPGFVGPVPGGQKTVGGTKTAGTGAGGGGGGGGGTTPPPAGPPPKKPPRTEQEVRDYIAENYSQWAYLQDIPEVWQVVKDAAKGEWSVDRVLGALQETPWWNKTEASARSWLEKKHQLGDAEILGQIRAKGTELQKAATAAGITIPPEELDALAEDALRFEWDPNETKAALGRFFKYDKGNLMGEALVTQQTLNQKARDWLVPMDDATMQKWVTQVVNGEVDPEYFDGYMKQQAQSLFPQLSDPISRGIPPGQWMSPYVSVAAQTLGVNPDSIDLRESKWLRSINQVDDKGARTAMNLADWEDLLKTDETYGWDKTDQGRQHGAEMARKMAQMFGRG